jgi:single-strand DNA-binding protein
MAKIIIQKCNLGRDAELKKTKNGDDVLTFPVGASQGHGDNKKTNWFRCSVWGKRAVSLAPYLVKGTSVGVIGELEIDEYEGKTQHKISVDPNGLEIFPRQDGGERKPTAHDKAKANGYQRQPFDDDLSDEVPF